MNNILFITLDSLRWDVFVNADAPNLKALGEWKRAWTQGTFTLPAHMAFFVGKLPQTLDGTDFYDHTAKRKDREKRETFNRELWRLNNPERAINHRAKILLEGSNIIDGFRKRGYRAYGTGAVNWFNPALPAGRLMTGWFNDFRFFDDTGFSPLNSAPAQIEWIMHTLDRHERSLLTRNRPFFSFINFGETHHRYTYRGCDWMNDSEPYGDHDACMYRQMKCLEYLDGMLPELLDRSRACDLVVCSDHGDAMGEDGLWGHGFFHEKVMEVPFLIRQC